MNSNHFQKFVFLGVLVAVALFSRVAYPTFYSISNGSGGASATAHGSVPFFVFPSSTSSSVAQSPSQSQASSSVTASRPAQTALVAQALPAKSPPAAPQVQAPTSLSTSVFSQTGAAHAPAINDHASLVADLQTGSVLYGTNIDVRWPLASVTKLMTASIVLDKFALTDHVTVTPAAVAADPQQTLLQAGDVYTVNDLLEVLLLPSSNVAAESLANAYGRAQFLAEMNARAAAWGMSSTHYNDPSGLSSGNQSTAHDLLVLAQKIYANYPQLLAITRTPQVTITELGSGRQTPVKSINDFAGRADFIGGKTGYTDEAAGNLLSIFNYDGHPLLIVVLGTDDGSRFVNTTQLYNWFAQNFK